MNLTDMDLLRGAIVNAMMEDMTVTDLWAAAEYAESVAAFERAVNELAQTMPEQQDT